jgi:hypothetical protein
MIYRVYSLVYRDNNSLKCERAHYLSHNTLPLSGTGKNAKMQQTTNLNTVSNNNQPLNAGMLVEKIERLPHEVTKVEEPNLINKESKTC